MRFLAKLRKKFNNVELFDSDLEDYQREAVQFLKDNPRSALFIDTGLGKTAICLRLIRDLVDSGEVNNVLIIAPLKVANQTWGAEIETWEFSAPIPYKLVRADHIVEAVNAAGRMVKNVQLTEKDLKKIERKVQSRLKKSKANNALSVEQEAQIERDLRKTTEVEYRKHLSEMAREQEAGQQLRAYEKTKPTIIHIINQEMVEWLVNALGENWIYDCVIYDESDAIKDASTKRWKALDSIKHLTTRFYELTATPAAEDYLGLFAQIKLLDGGKRLGRTMTEYKERYFNVNPYNYKITLKDGVADEITKAISDITLVMKQEDYLKDIPPYVIENVLYHLSDEAREYYDSMSRTGGVKLESGVEIYAEQAVSVLQKMMQISAGFIYESEETLSDFGAFKNQRIIHHLHDDKIKALSDLMVKHPNENFLISYYHQGSFEKLQKHFPKAMKMDRKGTQKQAWNDGKIKILLMHPKSGAHGLNLQKGGHIVINYDVYFSYALFYQFLRRLARRGQPHHEVLVYNLLAEATYDQIVERGCWVDKKNAQNMFFEMIKTLKVKKNGNSQKNAKNKN